ncbi:MAG: DUF177 domain-containing protein [Gemmatimonadetes bacterium]|nr:DUF177 domain-containing protein [Gemmatimonadota bacterium]
MLKLSLAALSREEVHAQWEIPADHPMWENTRLELSEPLHVEVFAHEVGEGVLVRGRMRTVLDLSCRRCLTRVRREIDEPVDLLFEPLTGEERDELEGEVYPLPMRGTELDLSESLREQLLLTIPEYVICAEACRGLCPQCGVDRNQATCECTPEQGSGPWDALKNFTFD